MVSFTKAEKEKLKKILTKSKDKEAKEIEEAIIENKNTTLFKAEAKFIAERTLKIGKETIKGKLSPDLLLKLNGLKKGLLFEIYWFMESFF